MHTQTIAAEPGRELPDALSHAREVILCITAGHLAGVLDALQSESVDGNRVHVLWRHSDLDLLATLLRRGYRVFDAQLAGPDRLFIDRNLGYMLPDYRPVEHASVRAAEDWWRRCGTFLMLNGVVAAVHPEQRVFQLRGREHFFITVPPGRLALPEPGADVEVLVNCPWASSRTLLAVAQRISGARPAAVPA